MVVSHLFKVLVLSSFISISLHAGYEKGDCTSIPKGKTSFVGKVLKLNDGDTLVVSSEYGNLPIRFLGIDTPETHYMQFSQGVWGERAADFLQSLAPVGTTLKVELGDGSSCDQYGRVLGHLWRGKMHLNKEIIKQALAVTYCIYPNMRYCEELGEITNQNIAEHKGMFSDPKLELPYNFRRRVSNRAPNQFVGDLKTHQVYQPGFAKVPVGNRIFFYNQEDIQAPYQLARE
jgi:endonuclease YncB( thermonuclease family)